MMTNEITDTAHTVPMAISKRRRIYPSMTFPHERQMLDKSFRTLAPSPDAELCLPLPPREGWEGCFTRYCLKKNVSGSEVAGVMPSGLLYCRSGMLPILTLTTRTP